MIPDFKIVMFATSNIAEYATLAADTNRRYCARHGYGFSFEQYDDVELGSSFEMIRVLQRHLWSAKYLLWLDCDACVINFSRTLDVFCDNGNDLVIAGYECGFDLQGRHRAFEISGVPCGLNAGVAMFRSSRWMEVFLRHWWEECVVAHEAGAPFDEQGPLQEMLMDNALGIQSRINLVSPASQFNRGDGDDSDTCHFVLHLWGASTTDRQRAFAAIAAGEPPDLGIQFPCFDVR